LIDGIDEIYRNYLTGTWAKYQYTHLCAGVILMPYIVRTQICRYLTDDLLFDQVLPFIIVTTNEKHASALKPGIPYYFDPTLVRPEGFAGMVAKAW
jgi:hypothetical protein